MRRIIILYIYNKNIVNKIFKKKIFDPENFRDKTKNEKNYSSIFCKQ